MDTKPEKPWDIYDDRQRRRLKAYFNALRARKEGGGALTVVENLDFIQLGRLIDAYNKEQAEAEQIRKEEEIRQAELAVGAAEGILAEVRRRLQEARREHDAEEEHGDK